MLEGILNAADQAMGGPQVQPPEIAPGAAPISSPQQGAPNQSVSFDVNQNPQDMQMMTDAMMYAPMLKSMDEDQRKEKWPQMVQSLSQVSPKASSLFDPSLPPSDKDLDMLMSRMQGPKEVSGQNNVQLASASDDYMADQVKRQLRGDKPESQVEFNARQSSEDQKKQEEAAQMKQQQAEYDSSYEGIIQRGTQLAAQSTLSKPAQLIKDSFASIGNAVGNALAPTAQAFSLNTKDPRYENAPANKRWKLDANGNVTDVLEPIPGSESDPTVKQANALIKQYTKGTQPTAGVVGLLKTAKDLVPTLHGNTWTDDWDLDVKALAAADSGSIYARVKGIALGKESVIKGEAYKSANNMRNQAIEKALTGATTNLKEAPVFNSMFACNAGDYAETCLQKQLNFNLFLKNIEHLVVDDPSTITGKNIDMAAVQHQNAAAAANVQKYKPDWELRMMQKYPNITKQELDRKWVKDMLTNPTFAATVMGEVNANKKQGKE